MAAPPAEFHFCFPIRVRHGEVDPQNIVFNSRYLEYCDVAETEYVRALGIPPAEAARTHRFSMVVVRAELDFVAPARLDDLLEARVRVVEMGRTSLTTHIEIRLADTGALVFRGRLVHVNIQQATGKPLPIPAKVRQAVTALEGGGPTPRPASAARAGEGREAQR